MEPEDIATALLALKKDAENAIAEAQKAKYEIDDAVNWGDLRVTDVQVCLGVDGVPVYRVEIEEVDPHAIKFHDFIASKLRSRGWSEIEIDLDW